MKLKQMKALKKGTRVSVPLGIEGRVTGSIVSGPHAVPEEYRKQHQEEWGTRAPKTWYKVRHGRSALEIFPNRIRVL